MAQIYSLTDPTDGIIKYVGLTTVDLKDRLKGHLNTSKKENKQKVDWINGLRKKKLKPIIDIIDLVPHSEKAYWETFYIGLFISWGFPLLNIFNNPLITIPKREYNREVKPFKVIILNKNSKDKFTVKEISGVNQNGSYIVKGGYKNTYLGKEKIKFVMQYDEKVVSEKHKLDKAFELAKANYIKESKAVCKRLKRLKI